MVPWQEWLRWGSLLGACGLWDNMVPLAGVSFGGMWYVGQYGNTGSMGSDGRSPLQGGVRYVRQYTTTCRTGCGICLIWGHVFFETIW